MPEEPRCTSVNRGQTIRFRKIVPGEQPLLAPRRSSTRGVHAGEEHYRRPSSASDGQGTGNADDEVREVRNSSSSLVILLFSFLAGHPPAPPCSRVQIAATNARIVYLVRRAEGPATGRPSIGGARNLTKPQKTRRGRVGPWTKVVTLLSVEM